MRRIRRLARWVALGACGGLLLWAPEAWGRSVTVNARAEVGVFRSTHGVFEFAAAVSDPSLGDGGLLATIRQGANGYVTTGTFVNRFGSLVGTLHATVREQGSLVHLSFAGPVTAATGRFAGARGTLTGTGTVTTATGVGVLRLHGTLRGMTGRAPGPPSTPVVRRVNGSFIGIEVVLARSGEETIVGPVTGVVPGPAVVVVHDRASSTTVRGTFSVFTAGGSATGVIDLRFRGQGSVRSESGTVSVTGGNGDLSGARTMGLGSVSGTRDLITEEIVLRIRGVLRL